jgi:hypothetical protein
MYLRRVLCFFGMYHAVFNGNITHMYKACIYVAYGKVRVLKNVRSFLSHNLYVII